MTSRPVTIDGITVRFGEQVVLAAFSTTLPERGVVGLIGPNGAGKSTLIDVLSGAVAFSGGEIRDQDDRPLNARSLRLACARLHQDTVVPESSTPDEYLELATRRWSVGALVFAARRRNAPCVAPPSSLLISADVLSGTDRPLARHSGGQRRAVALEAILAQQVPIVLLDEPLTGLSDASTEAALDAIAHTAQKRLVIIAEHRLPALQVVADTTLVLRDGRLVATLGRGQLTAEAFVTVSR